jgi:hypothetical protein
MDLMLWITPENSNLDDPPIARFNQSKYDKEKSEPHILKSFLESGDLTPKLLINQPNLI